MRRQTATRAGHLSGRLGLMRGYACAIVGAAALAMSCQPSSATEPVHAMAMHGTPALPPGFKHLPYVNPDAPKGGLLRLGSLGSFDSFNPFILKGVAPTGIREYVYQSLLERSADEPFSLYGLLADRVEMPDDRAWVAFHIDAKARFSDGKPVTAEDVVHSWRLLKDKGQPYHRSHYGAVAKAEITAPGTVRFTFHDTTNREAPLLLALMPILPRHLTPPDTFEQTSLAPPVGSGPYRVTKVDAGRSFVLERIKDWWAQDRPMTRGLNNFDQIRFEYFRDQNSLFEAFKSGEVDFRTEEDAGRWAESYDFPAIKEGRVVKAEIPVGWPAGMTALVFNTRREVFRDPLVRRALILMLDFEWINRNLFHGHYVRTQSFFERSELSSHARPADDIEKRLLAPYLAKVKPQVLAGTYSFPVSDGSGRNRENLKAAFNLLRQAGYEQRDGRMVNKATGQPLRFEMMSGKRAEERLFQSFADSLKRLGIEAEIRNTDSAQRWERLKKFDFDMIQWTWGASLSPGNEQVNRWGSASYEAQNALNFAGVKDPAVDAMIEALLAARERPQFVAAVRALDRLLISGDYVIPLYHAKGSWAAWWRHIKGPDRAPLSGITLDAWWHRAE
ncbi:MAG: extracellular solute-binding protein [Hyphomicrobiaceae bacterium]